MPVWEELLNEQDRSMFLKAKMGSSGGFGERAAVIVVDMTYGFVDSKFRLGCSEAGYPAAEHTALLLEGARKADVPVFYTRGVTEKAHSGNGLWKGGGEKSEEENTIVDIVSPAADDVVLEKRRPSAFFGTNLVDMLIYHKIDTIIVTGLTTSGCVRATVVDGFSYNYRVIVPEECVGDRSQLSHKVSLLDIHMKYGDVLPLQEILNWLKADTQ